MQFTNNTNITSLSLAISIVTIFGILLHDTQIGTATELAALERPVVGESINLARLGQHIHMDQGTFTGAAFSTKTAQPSAQPRNNDDKKYIAQRRYIGDSSGGDYFWPTI